MAYGTVNVGQKPQENIVTGVKGDAEKEYRTGNVNITAADLGLDKLENTADKDKNVKSAAKLSDTRTIDGVSFDGSADVTHYGTCSTIAATVEKTVSIANFKLVEGATVNVRFAVDNTANNPTLNVSGTGGKAIRYRNAAVSAGALAANRVYQLTYDGSYWQIVGDIDTDTTYEAATESNNGLMSAADKKKLNGISEGASGIRIANGTMEIF